MLIENLQHGGAKLKLMGKMKILCTMLSTQNKKMPVGSHA